MAADLRLQDVDAVREHVGAAVREVHQDERKAQRLNICIGCKFESNYHFQPDVKFPL